MNEKIITTHLTVNGQLHKVKAYEQTPLLTILRDHLKLKGTKYGCGKGLCGACSVHVDGELIRSCSYTIQQASESKITTIEGVSNDSKIKKIWVEEKVMQCGYCQAGQIMSALSLIEKNKAPSEEEMENHMTNICRCGTYPKIKCAIKKVIQDQSIGVEAHGR